MRSTKRRGRKKKEKETFYASLVDKCIYPFMQERLAIRSNESDCFNHKIFLVGCWKNGIFHTSFLFVQAVSLLDWDMYVHLRDLGFHPFQIRVSLCAPPEILSSMYYYFLLVSVDFNGFDGMGWESVLVAGIIG